MTEKPKSLKELIAALTKKQRVFCEYYVGEARFNATKAARLAGYSEKTAYSIGSENLRKPEISDYIELRLGDLTLSANEVLTRITEIANGKVDDLLDDDGYFNLDVARARGKTPLIKKLKQKRTVKQVSEDVEDTPDGEEFIVEKSIIYEEVEFEIYSAHEALRDLGKYHKLFTDRAEVDHNINLPEKLQSALEKGLLKAYGDEPENEKD